MCICWMLIMMIAQVDESWEFTGVGRREKEGESVEVDAGA